MKFSIQKYSLLVLLLLAIFSCSKDDGIVGLEEPVYDYYVNSSKLTSLQLPILQTMYSQAALLYPEAEELGANLKYSVEVNKMTYQTKLDTKKIQASALVCFPEKAGSYPVLCFQNGTNVLYDKAPTKNLGDQLFLLLESIASMGYIVVVPDYPGFGASENEVHPYLIKDLTVRALKDVLNATVEFAQENIFDITLNNDLYLIGYSQGGWATLQLQREIEMNGLGLFNLVGSSCGAGPYDIGSISTQIVSGETYEQPYFLAYIVNSYNEYDQFGSGININDIFNEPYALDIPDLFDGEHTPQEINSSLTTSIPDLITSGYRSGSLTDPAYESVRAAFAENSVESWNVETPTILMHGTADMTVPFNITSQMYEAFLQEGTDAVVMVPITGKGHSESIVPFGFASIQWFLDL
ncbi:alpha/beta hydrolase family protein [Sunxiuqinia sp. A32]|uniref:alpha/beta hydrolase family protein n=1 Tax=Sunxiuqinia sp. A32 TaxID=3461496 RepID=UPI0040464ECE